MKTTSMLAAATLVLTALSAGTASAQHMGGQHSMQQMHQNMGAMQETMQRMQDAMDRVHGMMQGAHGMMGGQQGMGQGMMGGQTMMIRPEQMNTLMSGLNDMGKSMMHFMQRMNDMMSDETLMGTQEGRETMEQIQKQLGSMTDSMGGLVNTMAKMQGLRQSDAKMR